MRAKPTKYSIEFKIQLVKEALEVKNSAMVARKYEIAPKLLQRWVREYQAGELGEGISLERVPSLEVSQLAKENDQLKKRLGEKDLENAILRDLVKKKTPHLLKNWK